MALPTVTSLDPASGPCGTFVTITGTNFLEDCTDVSFGTYSCGLNYTVISDTAISAIAPAGTGTVTVKVTTSGGQNSTGAQFTFSTYEGGSNAVPTVTNVSPGSSATTTGEGGDTVTITGTGFATARSVVFGTSSTAGVYASFTIDSTTQITATSPKGTGTVYVFVENIYGWSTDADTDNDFAYSTGSAPTVSTILPTAGFPGDSITVTGTNFTNANAVTFGTLYAEFRVVNSTSIIATVPAGGTIGSTVDVLVVNEFGTASDPGTGNNFTYGSIPQTGVLKTVATYTSGGAAIPTSPNAGWITSDPVSITLTPSYVGGPGVESTWYRLDSAAAAKYSTAFNVSNAGSHKLEYWSVGTDGYTETTNVGYVNIVATKTVTITATPAMRAIVYKWNAVNIPGIQYKVYIDTTSTPTTWVATVKDNTYIYEVESTATAVYCRIKTLEPDGTESAYSAAVGPTNSLPVAADAVTNGIIDGAAWAASIRPPLVVDTLPTLPSLKFPTGAMVFLTTDQRLYKVVGGGVNNNSDTINRAKWQDLSGYDHDFTSFSGFGWSTDGWEGTGTAGNPYHLHFDGTDGYITMSGDSDFDGNFFTWDLWYKYDGLPGTFKELLLGHESYLNNGYRLGITTTGKVEFWATQSGGSGTVTSTDSLVAGAWNHIAVTWNNVSTGCVWVNGVRDYGTMSIVANTSDGITIGSDIGGGYLDGRLAVLRRYNTVLSDAQIIAQYTMGPAGLEYQKTDLKLDLNAKQALRTGMGPHGNSDTDKATWYDQSTSGNNVSLTSGWGYSETSGWDGVGTGGDPWCLQFNATDLTYARTGSVIHVHEDKVFSIEAWARIPLGSTATGYLIYLGTSASGYNAASLGLGAGVRPYLRLADASTFQGNPSTGIYPLADGAFHHIVGTSDGTTMRTYLDGVECGTGTTITVGTIGTSNVTTLGRNEFSSPSGYSDAGVAALRVYDRTLTAAEVLTQSRLGPSGQGYSTTNLVLDLNGRFATKQNHWVPAVDGGDMTGLISGNQIMGNTITAGQIKSASITSDEIAANTIVAKNVFVGNWDNLIPNATSEADTTGKEISGTAADVEYRLVSTGAPYVGSKHRRLGGTGGTVGYAITPRMPCIAGEKYYLECWGKLVTAANSGTLELRTYDKDGASTGTANVGSINTATYTKYIMADSGHNYYQIPATAVTMDVYMTTSTLAVGNYLDIDNMFLRRMSEGNLIVDGDITGDKITANVELTAPVITGGVLQTATSGKRVVIDSDSLVMERIRFYTGSTGETMPGTVLTASSGANDGSTLVQSAEFGSSSYVSEMRLHSTNTYSNAILYGNSLSEVELNRYGVATLKGDGGVVIVSAEGTGTITLNGILAHTGMFKDCITAKCDFLNKASVYGGSTSVAVDQWFAQDIGSGATNAAIDGGALHPGCVEFTSAAASNSGRAMYTDTSSITPGSGMVAEFVFLIDTLSTNIVARLGFMDTIASTTPAKGAYLDIYNASGTLKIQGIVGDGTLHTSGDNYALAADTWYTGVVSVLDSSSMFKVYNDSGTLLLNTTVSNTATGPVAHAMTCYTAGSSAIDLLTMDYMSLYIPTTGRGR